ncbi:heavy metal translocating P-type ATPase [Paenibacillus mesophilus]|uniref:heavy metal translocating P-type ATPase n=1 Tax=Paenibacillus mesophilus TaxID=2582849 RepID=UPI001EE45FC0|nr:heavy metal translocating P-type ATPase [Paenibacillus mesophilus]
MSRETEQKEFSFKKKLAFTVQEPHRDHNHSHDEAGCHGHSCGREQEHLHDGQEAAAAIEPNERLRSYRIEGMDCGSCAMTIENHLRMHPSVKQVRIQFATGKMQIEHDNSVEEIVKEVGKAGYRASLITSRVSADSAEADRRDPHKSMTVLSGVLLLFAYLGQFASVSAGFQTILYALSIVIGGYKPARSAFYAIKSKSLDMNVLMTVAALGAACIGEWLEGAAVVWLFAFGNMLQNMSMERTRGSIRSLMSAAPAEAWVKQDGRLARRPIDEVAIGSLIVVKPGEKIPLDGIVAEGQSGVNQAPITGESVPVDKSPGDPVYAGTINESGALEIRVTKRAEDTTIARIVHLVEEAQEKKAPAQAFVDRFAAVYTPVVFGLAMLVMIVPPLLDGAWSVWIYRGLELLVIACPCALVISTPVAIVSAIGSAARNGVLIKGGASLEKAGRITAVAFDKTGTLTTGKPRVVQTVVWESGEKELLSIARTIEDRSKHPIAAAIIREAAERNAPLLAGTNYSHFVGKGAGATIDGVDYFAGNVKLFQELRVGDGPWLSQAADLQTSGHTLVLIGTQDRLLGMFAVADTIRESTVTAIRGLKGVGVRQAVLLTGDNEGTARKIAKEAGIDEYVSELLPEQKVSSIVQLQERGERVAMVGDGINDAPALATADLGIAMGGAGTDTAMETADIVLMADHLEKLPYTVRISRQAMIIIKQNVWFSLIVKFAALLLIFPGWLTLWMAVLSDTGAALLVILNSMRLLGTRNYGIESISDK